MRFFRLAVPAALLVALALTLRADAQVPADPPPVLHEDVRPPANPADVAAAARRHIGAQPRAGENPAAFSNAGKILPEPDRRAQPAPEEPVLGRGGFAADRDTRAAPDRQTGPDSTLHYVTVFNPSVLPFKRMSAMDTVGDDYVLSIGSRALEDLPVGGDPSPERDMFWGSVLVELTPGVDVPLPSVAPDMRVLSWEIEPQTEITFSKDAADNYYVRSDESGARGTYRLVFLVDADAGHFVPSVPTRYSVADVARLAGPARLRPLPPGVQRVADRAINYLGLTRRARLDVAVNTLVTHFRSFEPGPSPPSSGDIYWDLFESRTGVCRHRSFAFMITANGLGLPTRYVTNEAHAWVEMWMPDEGWQRIDLGGAALRLEFTGAEDKSMYRERGPDTLPQPDNYRNNYTQLEGDIRGLSGEQIAERRQPSSGDGDGDGTPDGDAVPSPDGPATREDGTAVGPGRSLPQVPAEALRGKRPARIAVTDAAPVGFRGEAMAVSGRLTSGGAGVPDQRVDIYLAPVGRGGDDAIVVGHGVTTSDGSFAFEVELPSDLPLRDYEVYAASPGGNKLAPALSD